MATRASAPNVVLFISDQHRADTMPGIRASTMVRTPHLEWLAARGTLFRHAYCTSPICTPARASLLTGLYPHRTGMVANHDADPVAHQMRLPPDVKVLADYLKPLGYTCAYTGKWHLGGGDRRGFSDFVTRLGNFDADDPSQNDILRFCERAGIPLSGRQHGCEPDPADYDRRTRTGASLLPLAWHGSMLDAMAAAHFIRSITHEDRPFLLVYSCRDPHQPFVSPRPFDQMYKAVQDQLPLPETRRDAPASWLVKRLRARMLATTASFSDDDLRCMWAAYYGDVSYVDHLVGTILAALLETDQLDDTLFIFTADHGELLGSHGLLYKGAVLYEELVNVPLLVKPPGGGPSGGRAAAIAGGHQTDRLVSHVDLVPTILRWCGAEVPDALPGVDIRSLVEGGNAPVREGIGLEFHSGAWGSPLAPQRSWRTEDWKYVETLDGTDELYNLRRDPQERHNLIDDPAAASAREAMRRELHAWLGQTADRWPDVPVPPRAEAQSR